jgi:uncharacterized lipoprotein YehR (DUF1307 family)
VQLAGNKHILTHTYCTEDVQCQKTHNTITQYQFGAWGKGQSDAENVLSDYSADLEMNGDNVNMAFKDAVSVTWMHPIQGKTQE